MLVGLVHAKDWEPPEDVPQPPRSRSPRVPWRLVAWLAACAGLLALSSVADDLVGPLAGYVVLLLAVTLGFWRVERWCSRQYWAGLREYQS
jgi:fatty acid desaturase